MGRPINKRRFGSLPNADDAVFYPLTGDTFFNLRVNAQVDSEAEVTTAYILAQKGSTRFLVSTGVAVNDESVVVGAKYEILTVGDTVWTTVGATRGNYIHSVFTAAAAGAGTGTAARVSVCKLVDKADGTLGANEMSIMGQISTGGQVRIKKMYNRTCRDFNNVRYKWAIVDDSTATLLLLTPF
jgi:hypothetical protein